jgi:outer membrane protein assembly factor BamE (lipoprotein component of BamABCDE complex)
MQIIKPVASIALLLAIAACAPASEHARDVAAANAAQDRLTVGTVQREIREGMSGADVASALGAPNIVTRDNAGEETWVYDRISTTKAYSTSAGGVNALFLAGASASAGASETSQRTLTIVIRFDKSARVRSFSYRSSSF